MCALPLILLLAVSYSGMAQSMDRGLGNPKITYIPKGQFCWGVSGSYIGGAARSDDPEHGYGIAGILSDIKGEADIFKVNVHGSWFFRDNISLGIKLGYVNSRIDIDNMVIAKLTTLSNDHIRRETYSCHVVGRRYVPLFNSKVLALFGEVGLGVGFGYNKTYELTERGKEGTFSKFYDMSLTTSAGVSVFLLDDLSLELSIPVFSAGYQWTKMLEKQEYESTLNGFYISKATNILGIKLGIVYYY